MSETTNLKLFKHDNPSTNENAFNVEEALNENWDKIDEHAGEVDNKIDTLEEDNTQNKSDISDLQESQEEQDAEIGILMNALPSETQEGENINIKGTIPVKFKEFVVGGNSKQDTRDGKNFYNPEEIIRTGATDEEGWITLSHNNTSSATVYLNAHHSLSDNIKPLTNYYLILEIKEVSGNASLVVSQYLSNSKSQIYTNLSENLEGLVAGQKKKYSVYSIENLDEAVYMLRTFLSVPAGENAKIVYRLSLIEQDVDIDNFEYEPYGVSPSPDYPSEIQNVKGDVNVTVCNKNLYELDGKLILRNGVDYIIENNSIIAERKTVSSSGSYYNDMTRKKLLAGTYTISGVDSSFIYEKARVEILVADSENKDESKATRIGVISNDRPSIQYSSDKDFYIGFSVVVTGKSDVGEIFVFKPQVEVGSTATNFVENKKQIITFPLLEGQKLYLNDYFADDGIHHVRKQVELDGTEEIIQYTRKYPNTYGYRITIKGLKSSENKLSALSSRYKSITFSDFYNNAIDHIGEMAIHNSTDSYVYFGSNKTTVEEFKEEVKGTVLEFTLVEEEVEEYTPEQQEAYNQLKQLKAYEEETNIFSTDGISPIFKVKAVKDINSVITQLNQLILENGGN